MFVYCADGDIADLVKGGSDATEVIFFSTSSSYTGNLGGRSGADQFCQTEYNTNFTNLNKTNIRAVLSVDANDTIASMPANYGLPGNVPVKGSTGLIIADTWTGLLNAGVVPLKITMSGAGAAASDYWTGADITGGFSADHCMNWASSDGIYNGTPGLASSTNTGWISSTVYQCTNSNKVLCAAW